jgi:hypothetical protein
MIEQFGTLQAVFMTAGFLMALYACVANDVIQTLGTFLSSNMKRSRLIIWAFTSTVLVATMSYGYFTGDMAFGRLDRIPMFAELYWWHLLPPLVLILLTWRGIPVSTTFLLLSVFSTQAVIGSMILKSVAGYAIAFMTAVFAYCVIARYIESRWLRTSHEKTPMRWVIMQWTSTAFLWSQWLMQDAANILVYLPRDFTFNQFLIIVTTMVAFMWLIVMKRGGKIQRIVMEKTNTMDMRSATIIDFMYGFILFFFLKYNNVPMSTTWVFLGLLAGREITLYYRLNLQPKSKMWNDIRYDLRRVLLGLAISISVVYGIFYIAHIERWIIDCFEAICAVIL